MNFSRILGAIFLSLCLMGLTELVFGQTYSPPYVDCAHWGQTIGVAESRHSCNRQSGALGAFARAYAGGGAAEAKQYLYIEVSTRTQVSVDATITYIGGTVAYGFAAFAGTQAVWEIDGAQSRQDIDPAFGYDDIAQKVIDLALLGAGGISSVAEAAEKIGLIYNAVQLAAALDQLRTAGKAKQFHIKFSFDAAPGRHTVGVGFRVNVSGMVTGSAFAVMAGQVSSVVVSGIPGPGTPSGPTILNVPGLGTVFAGPNSRSVIIQSAGPVIEYTLQDGATYQQGEVGPNQRLVLNIPHYAAFTVTIARPVAGKMGWIHARENDNALVYVTQTTTGSTNLGSGATILSVPGLGMVKAGSGRTVIIQSTGPVIEYTLQYRSTYQQGEVGPNQSLTLTIPHYTSFTLTIARPIERKIGWLHGRENDDVLVYVTQTTTGAADLGSGATILAVPGLGTVRAGSGRTVVIQSTGPVIEYTLQYGSTYQQGEVGANQSLTLSIPHYTSFTLTIARPAVGKIGWIHARENDGVIVYITRRN